MIRLIKVNAYQKATIYKNDRLIEILKEGIYLRPIWYDVIIHNIDERIKSRLDIELLIKERAFLSEVKILDVPLGHVAIIRKNEAVVDFLYVGKYAFWNDATMLQIDLIDLDGGMMSDEYVNLVLSFPILSELSISFSVASYERAILYLNDSFHKIVGPGLYRYWKGTKSLKVDRVDIRNRQLDINGQEILTKDKATIRCNIIATYQVTDIVKALINTKDYEKQLYYLMQLAVREYIGTRALDEILANREDCNSFILQYVQKHSDGLGVTLSNCGIRDIILPGDMRTIMNQVLIAEKKAQANVIMRREETASTRSLLNTAKLMQDNEMLYKLKEMEYIEKIAENIGSLSVNGGGQLIDQLKSLFSANSSTNS